MTQLLHGTHTPASTTDSGRLAAVGFIWVASAITAITAPDMVSGSEHEHLPIAAITIWLWTIAASGYAAMTPVADARAWLTAVAIVWTAMAATSILAPLMETGSDPTSIPIAALVAPPVATVVTGFLGLHQASARRT